MLWQPMLQLVCALMVLERIPSVISIQCFICDTANDSNCVENRFKKADYQSEECQPGTNYCSKLTVTDGNLYTRRYCSSTNVGTLCEELPESAGKPQRKICYYTCDKDECNGASRLGIPVNIWTVIGLISMYMMLG